MVDTDRVGLSASATQRLSVRRSWSAFGICIVVIARGEDGYCFTLYREGEGYRDDCWRRTVGITSGCFAEHLVNAPDRTPDAILDYQSAGMTLEMDGPDCQDLLDAGNIRDVGERSMSERNTVEREDS